MPLIDRLTQEGGVHYFLAPGNHDVTPATRADAPDRATGLRNLLDAMSAFIPPDDSPRRLRGYPTYAFGYGNTFVLALDSNIAGDETQFRWAKSQLDGLDRTRWINLIAVFHHPPFSSGPHGASILEPQSAALRSKYMPLFREHHVGTVIAGHDHLFEHWVERYTDASGPHRMDLVTTGGGGAPLYNYEGEPDLRAYLKANAGSKLTLEHLARPGAEPGSNPYHHVVVRVDGDSLGDQRGAVDRAGSFMPYRSNRIELEGSPR